MSEPAAGAVSLRRDLALHDRVVIDTALTGITRPGWLHPWLYDE